MGARVLLVDDDPEIGRFLELLLELEGFEATSTTSPQEALAGALAAPPDAVLVDVSMPGMDGFALCRALRSAGFAGALLMVSARPGDEAFRAALAAGADAFVRKPFDNAELVAALRAQVAARRLDPS